VKGGERSEILYSNENKLPGGVIYRQRTVTTAVNHWGSESLLSLVPEREGSVGVVKKVKEYRK
jgi:hypothetical protein